MRDIPTIIVRLRADLPVTDEELNAVAKHIEDCKKSSMVWHGGIIVTAILVILTLCISKVLVG